MEDGSAAINLQQCGEGALERDGIIPVIQRIFVPPYVGTSANSQAERKPESEKQAGGRLHPDERERKPGGVWDDGERDSAALVGSITYITLGKVERFDGERVALGLLRVCLERCARCLGKASPPRLSTIRAF